MPSLQRRRDTRKSEVLGTRLEGEVEKLENPKSKRQSTIEKDSVEFSAKVADMWSATMDDKDITSTTCDDFDEKFDIDDENWDHYWNTVDVVADDIFPAIVPERDKGCDVTAGEQTRKKTTWLMLDRVMLRVLEEACKHTCWWYELCCGEKFEGRSRQQIWRQAWSRLWRLLAWCDPRRGAEIVSSQAAKYVSRRTVRHHVSPRESSQ